MNHSKLAVAISIAVLAQQGYAADETIELDKTVVEAEDEKSDIKLIDSDEISKKGITNITDIVRHIPGVQINDTGDRFNDSGFNIRGVEGDDVAITVDGLSQGETLSPPTFAPYGLFGSNRQFPELETVKAIEIVKGPSSVLNGSGALGGSVAVTTKDASDYLKPDSENDTALEIKTGFDGRSNEMLVSTAFANRSGGLETLLMYVVRDGHESESHQTSGGGTGAGRTVADPFDIKQDSVLAKFAYSFDDNRQLGFVYENHNRDTTGNPLSRDSSTYYDFVTDDASNRERIGISFDYSATNEPLFDSVSVTLDHQDLFTHGVTAFAFNSGFGGDSSTNADDILRMEDRSFTQNTLDFGIDFEKALGANAQHKLIYGFAYNDSSLQNELFDRRFATVDPNSEQTQNERDPSWIPDTDKTVFNLYIQDEFTLNNALSFTAGARYDSTDYSPVIDENFQDPLGVAVPDAEFSQFTGQFSTTYNLNQNNSITLLYAQGYKAPTAQQIYLDTDAEPGGLVDNITGASFDDWNEIGNPDLGAETVSSVELSYQWTGERAYFKVNAFTADYSDRIENVALARDLGQTILISGSCGRFGCSPDITTSVDEYNQAQNVGEVQVKGIELESALSLTDSVALSFTASRIDGEHKTALADFHNVGDELTTASPDSATLGLTYRTADDKWGGSANFIWTDAREQSNDLSFTSLNNGGGPVVYTDSSVVLDLDAYYNVTENFSVTAKIHNLTDEEYIRWEVINGVRLGNGGFFSGSTIEGAQRFTEPGRNLSVQASYKF